jgi:hypothetical protein
MNETELFSIPAPVLTPRQDRIESSIERVLRTGGTRSELRELVEQFADLARLEGLPPERAVSRIKSVAMRATMAMAHEPEPPVGDSPSDRIAMIVRWCASRYYRAD